ncbi:MAG: PAS domain S-box protein [Planctomycetes bacterium]|nr:PAS domain S-box protein [Planctomycetota bacterium]
MGSIPPQLGRAPYRWLRGGWIGLVTALLTTGFLVGSVVTLTSVSRLRTRTAAHGRFSEEMARLADSVRDLQHALPDPSEPPSRAREEWSHLERDIRLRIEGLVAGDIPEDSLRPHLAEVNGRVGQLADVHARLCALGVMEDAGALRAEFQQGVRDARLAMRAAMDAARRHGAKLRAELVTRWDYLVGLIVVACFGAGVTCLVSFSYRREIALRRAAEETLRNERNAAEKYLDVAAVILLVLDSQGRIAMINRKGCEILGRSRDELLGCDWFATCLKPADRQVVGARFSRVVSGASAPSPHYENYVVDRNGGARLIAWYNTVLRDDVGNIIGTLSSGTDVTEQRRAEDELRASHELLSAVSNAQAQYISADGPQVVYSDLVASLLHLTQSEFGFIGEVQYRPDGAPYLRSWAVSESAWTDDLRTRYGAGSPPAMKFDDPGALCGAVLATQRPLISNDVAADPRARGTPRGHRPLQTYMGLPLLHQGTLVGMAGVANRPDGYDERMIAYLQPFLATCAAIVHAHCNERRRVDAEDALRESESRTRLALEAGRMGCWEWDPSTDRLTYSDELGPIFGLPRGAAHATYEQFLAAVHPDDRSAVAATVSAALESETAYSAEFRVVWPDGRVRWVSGLGRLRHDERGGRRLFTGVTMDVTARKEAEALARRQRDDLAHALRVSTLGEMASGLAHELNQPLTVIVNYAQGCVRRLQSGDAPREELAEGMAHVARQALRAGAIIRRLRNFVSKAEPMRTAVGLHEVIHDVLTLVRADLRHEGITVDLDLGPDVGEVSVDGIQIQQVLTNLVRNAADAMREVATGERSLEIATRLAGDDAAEVCVSDSGAGLRPEAQARLFEPFFTTKAGGMGMGLAISRSIVEAHGGRIWALSNPARGLSVHFTLPLAKEIRRHEQRTARVHSGR